MSNLHQLKAKSRAAAKRALMADHAVRSATARAALLREIARLAALHKTWLCQKGTIPLYPRDLEVAELVRKVWTWRISLSRLGSCRWRPGSR